MSELGSGIVELKWELNGKWDDCELGSGMNYEVTELGSVMTELKWEVNWEAG